MSRRILSRVLARLAGIFVLFHGAASGAQEGNFDPTFGNGGRLLVDVSVGHGDVAHRMVLLPGNKILMAGSCDHPQSAGSMDTYPEFCITRLLPDGGYDGTFGPGGVGYLRFDFFPGWFNSSDLKDMIVLHDGRIALLGTETAAGKMLLAILLADGSALDTDVGAGKGYLELQFANASSRAAVRRQAPVRRISHGYQRQCGFCGRPPAQGPERIRHDVRIGRVATRRVRPRRTQR